MPLANVVACSNPHMERFEFPFPVGTILLDKIKGEEIELSNAVAIWEEGKPARAAWVTYFSSSHPPIGKDPTRLGSYVRFIKDYARESWTKWLDSSQEAGDSYSVGEILTYSQGEWKLHDRYEIILPNENNSYVGLSPDFIPIMKTINRLWKRQDYYKTYIGKKNEMPRL